MSPSPNILSRRSLPYIPLNEPPSTESSPGINADVIAILAALVCAVIIGLVLNIIVRLTIQVLKQIFVRPEPSPLDPVDRFGAQTRALSALPMIVYSGRVGLHGLGSECTICLSDFVGGERVRVLPNCGHGFHADCVDRWLTDHSTCPMCRRCLFSKSSVEVEGLMENCTVWC